MLRKFCKAAIMLVGLALYASMISVLSSVFFSCERLFCGVYPAKASLIFASSTPKKRPMVMAASALGKLYSPISCV